ncbi:hypothetical protein F511_07396 [Dorcoceras hygrometricum]|uniref:Tify domain-containing protein n=1 Tax=Dorcoceras hygrometricum TaxID=472368 RepID=A0A2Z7BBU8_9LAMI|nr:hypothetical protein F511_07396 [Dorcoceras hygrometricum]
MLKWCWKSFQENDSSTPNGSDSLANSEMSYEPSSGINQKRCHQISMDASKKVPIFYKKQAVESVNTGATLKAAILNDPLWHDCSSYHPGNQTGDGLFIPKLVPISNASDNNVPSIYSSGLNIKTKDSGDQFGNDAAVLSSLHHSSEDPLCLKSGVRRVKVKEVKISENRTPELVENSFRPQRKNEPRSENAISFEPTYRALHGSSLIVNPPFSRTENHIFSLGAASERDGSYNLDNQYKHWVHDNMPYTGHTLDGGNYNTTGMLNWYEKENGDFMSSCPTHNYYRGNFFTKNPFLDGSNEALNPILFSSNEVNATSVKPYHGHPVAVAISPRDNFLNANSIPRPMSDNYKNSEQTTIPFRGFHNNAGENDSSGGLISSYAGLPCQSSGALGDRDSVGHESLNAISAPTSKIDGAQNDKGKKATKRRAPSNNFPANVKSLLSTGILDGVPVKYVSWSREMTLRGVVNGTRYICGCQECKLAKVLNAYEFENHAGYKTKHPNNHIYFENGKSIYSVAHELKNTPREMLFDVMQNVTGSMINKKNFEIWKESYKVTLELQRRGCMKTDAVMPS